jgi:hypothetical protein
MSGAALPEPWTEPDTQRAQALERELQREISPGHPLAGCQPRAIAACTGCDNVLFALDNDTWALVHLTWTGTVETPPWPRTTQIGSFFAVDLVASQHSH